MKAVSQLAVVMSLGVCATFASAESSVDTYLETCRKDPGVPVPIAVVAPSVGAEYSGSKVEIEFVVDEQGLANQFRVRTTPDLELARIVVETVKQWRFKPAESDGKPVATKVVLPVRIQDETVRFDRYAAR